MNTSTSKSDDYLKQENKKLQEEIKQLKIDIQKMKPFVELTKTIREESPKMWEYYATKTVKKNSNNSNK